MVHPHTFLVATTSGRHPLLGGASWDLILRYLHLHSPLTWHTFRRYRLFQCRRVRTVPAPCPTQVPPELTGATGGSHGWTTSLPLCSLPLGGFLTSHTPTGRPPPGGGGLTVSAFNSPMGGAITGFTLWEQIPAVHSQCTAHRAFTWDSFCHTALTCRMGPIFAFSLFPPLFLPRSSQSWVFSHVWNADSVHLQSLFATRASTLEV